MKNLLLFAVIILFYACKSKEVLTPNRPPNAFTVTPTLKNDGKTVVLNWTKAKDPDGDAVIYAVVLKDTLVKNISDTTYTIASLDFNFSHAGKIIAQDAKGLTSEASFTAITEVQTFLTIPDANFEKYLVEQKIDKDGLVNGRMELVDTKGVKEIDLRPIDVKSLVGIEAFTDLERLSYGSTLGTSKLSILNISKNTKLEYLWLGGVYLSKELDISQNTNLKSLSIIYSGLLNLDITKHIKLEYLRLHGNSLTNIDVSQNINLEHLACSMSRLRSLDVSKNILLKSLICQDNQLTNLDVSKNISLDFLACDSNKLTNLDVSQNTNLTVLRCEFNNLTNLNLENNIQLEFLWCYINNLTSLNLSKNIKLKELRCMKNNLLKTVCVADLSKTTNWDKDPTMTFEVCK